MRVLLVIAILLIVSVNAHCIEICKSGHTRAVIVRDNEASKPDQNAANELAKYLSKITGAYFRQTAPDDTAIKNSNKIYVGRSGAVDKLLPGFNWDKLGNDGILIRTVGNNLILAGGQPRGTLYAVYTFLEDHLGCRWWTKTVEDIPQLQNINIQKIDYQYIPKFIYRESHYRQSYDPNYVQFAVKMKLNGVFNPTSEEWGGHIKFINGGHSFGRLISSEKYFDTHPEWFSLVRDERLPKSQLCLSNPEMRKEIIKNVLKSIVDNPDANIVDVSQNDNQLYCTCPECNAIAEKYGGQSGLMVDFINEIARAVAKDYPNHYVMTFAYQYSRFAPKGIKPEPNVLIRLCSIENDNSVPLTGKNNLEFYNALNEWHQITNQFFIWDYIANFTNYHIPHPNTHVMAKNIKLFADAGTIGMFAQGDYYNDAVCFHHVRNWVISKLLWNPDLDGDHLMDTFLNGYYGKSAGTIKQIMQLYTDSVLNAKYKLTCYNQNAAYFTLADYKKGFELFDKALSEADNAQVRERIEVQRKGLQLAMLLSNRKLAKEAVDAGVGGVGDPNKWCEDYYDWAMSSDNTYIGEGRLLTMSYFKHEGIFTAKRGVRPAQCEGLSDDEWFDWQDDAFLIHQQGTWTFVEKDPNASDGSAVRMPNTHDEWAINILLAPLFNLGIDRAEIIVRLRKANDTSPSGFKAGVYEGRTATYVMNAEVKDSEISTEYKDFSLGTHSFSDTGQRLWISPVKLGTDNSIYVDRVFFIKDGAGKQ